MHSYCASRKFERQEDPKCPSCSGDWILSKKRRKSTGPSKNRPEKTPQPLFDDDFVIPATPSTKPVETSDTIPSSSQGTRNVKKGKASALSSMRDTDATPARSTKKTKRNRIVMDNDSDE
jgi:hypothetical protein